MDYTTLGIAPGTWLLPAETQDPARWACIACDQYTSQPEYWADADRLVGNAPSTLRMIVPECDIAETDERVPVIHRTMREYMDSGVLVPAVENGMILTERITQSGTRFGLILKADLECYDYRATSKTLIRATEATIESRLPTRMKVRRGADLEAAHVLMLCDDTERTVIEPIAAERGTLRKLYDFELMLGGGHVAGYAIEDDVLLERIYGALDALRRKGGETPLLFAVGDGNHSLASAKSYWEELKAQLSDAERAVHPARYAMVELENIHDPALRFEPIHRIVFGCDAGKLRTGFAAWMNAHGMTLANQAGEDTQEITLVSRDGEEQLHIAGSPYGIAVATLQRFLDEYLPGAEGAVLDYVHGADAVRSLVNGKAGVGWLLPKPNGHSLFSGVISNGSLPRKTFSLGESNEKRYYLECRKISK